MRTLLVTLCRLLLRIFFRRIEVVGSHHLPSEGSVIFALNHPSGLVDPLFILCLSRRRVSFLAKEPLFRMPLIGTFVRAFECLPVYRQRDGADPQQNRAMMERAVALLGAGNALALFPEGTSHNDPELKPFKTGAARIALCARALGEPSVWMVPAALYYERKHTFRSRAVLAYGPPLAIPSAVLDEQGEPPRETVHALTGSLRQALQHIMPTAETVDGLTLAEQAERVLGAAARDEGSREGRVSLALRMSTRRRLIDAYRELVELEPEVVHGLSARLRALGEALEQRGLPIDAGLGRSAGRGGSSVPLVLWTLLLAPLGCGGALIHYPTYRLIRWLAFRYAGEEADVLATVKLVGGLLLYPLTWLLVAGGLALWTQQPLFLLTFFAGPPLAWWSLRFVELFGALLRLHRRRAALSPERSWAELEAERTALAGEILALLGRHPPRTENSSGNSLPRW